MYHASFRICSLQALEFRIGIAASWVSGTAGLRRAVLGVCRLSSEYLLPPAEIMHMVSDENTLSFDSMFQLREVHA